jgi:CubicO group peptidase (beta-lactamase class C family)
LPKAAPVLALLAALGSAAPAAAAAEESLPDRVDRHLRTKASGPLSGVVLVAQFGQVWFHRAYGYASAEASVPNATTTRFAIASLTKPITAAAVLRQVELGKIRLEASICDYLAACPRRWKPVTIRHLLSHTSGLPDLFEKVSPSSATTFRPAIDAAVAAHGAAALSSRPGSRYAYNNFNYFLLGYALEAVTGESWDTAVRAAVLAPAAMAATGYDVEPPAAPAAASGYRRVDAGRVIAAPHFSPAAYAAGGLVSTAEDLLRFEGALSGGKIVEAATLQLMTKPGLGRYALGWQVLKQFGRMQRNHTGQLPGYASHIARYDDGTTIILLSNVDNEPAQDTACEIAALSFGLPLPGPGKPACPAA